MVVHSDAVEFDSVLRSVHEVRPPHWLQVPRAVVPANLKVPSVLPQTQTESPHLYEVAFLHDIEYGLHVVREGLLRESEYPICVLRVKQVVLTHHAAKHEVKAIFPRVEALSKVHFVLDYEPVVAASLSVALVELAPVVVEARAAAVLLAVVDVL